MIRLEVENLPEYENPDMAEIAGALDHLDGEKASFAIISQAETVYLQTCGSINEGFRLEYCDETGDQYACQDSLTFDDLVSSFQSYARGEVAWQTDHRWKFLKSYAQSKTRSRNSEPKNHSPESLKTDKHDNRRDVYFFTSPLFLMALYLSVALLSLLIKTGIHGGYVIFALALAYAIVATVKFCMRILNREIPLAPCLDKAKKFPYLFLIFFPIFFVMLYLGKRKIIKENILGSFFFVNMALFMAFWVISCIREGSFRSGRHGPLVKRVDQPFKFWSQVIVSHLIMIIFFLCAMVFALKK